MNLTLTAPLSHQSDCLEKRNCSFNETSIVLLHISILQDYQGNNSKSTTILRQRLLVGSQTKFGCFLMKVRDFLGFYLLVIDFSASKFGADK